MTDQNNNLDFAFRMLDYDNSKSYQARKATYEAKKTEGARETENEKRKVEYASKKAKVKINTFKALTDAEINKEIFQRDAEKKRMSIEEYINYKEKKDNFSFMIKKLPIKKLSMIFIIFSIMCLITLLILNASVGDTMKAEVFSGETLVGPINIKNDNAVYLLKVSTPVLSGRSTYISGEVLDQDKNSLFGFGNDVWDEDGYDYEGYYWHESKKNYDINITFPQKGLYYLKFQSEDEQNLGQSETVDIELTPRIASSLFFAWFTSISFILSVGLFVYYIFKNFNEDSGFVNFGKQIIKWIGWILLIIFCIWIETI